MSGRPILSGHCASADLTSDPVSAHERCKLDACPCACHLPPPEPPPAPRVKVSLRCLTGDCDGCPAHANRPGSVLHTPCGCPHPIHNAVTDDLQPAGVQLTLEQELAAHQGHRSVTVPDSVGGDASTATYNPPDAAADGYAWPDLPYDGTLTTHDRQRIAAAWLAYDLPGAYATVETILREHGAGS